MQDVLTVRWSLVPLCSPRPWRHCRRCERERPFVSSGRFRVNAQKKRLDAWLIYRCAQCDATWNLPLLERHAVELVPPERLARLSANDAELAAATANDLVLLRRHCHRVEPAEGVALAKRRLAGARDAPLLRLELAVPLPCPLRLDRLLAAELGLPRGELRRLAEAGLLRVPPATARALKRPPQDGLTVELRLGELDGALAERLRQRAVAGGAFGPSFETPPSAAQDEV